jgi:hypothetical protein
MNCLYSTCRYSVTRLLSQIDPETSLAKTTRHADDPRFASAGTLKGPKQLLGWRTYAKSWRNSIRVS